jgi:hypothetical protein
MITLTSNPKHKRVKKICGVSIGTPKIQNKKAANNTPQRAAPCLCMLVPNGIQILAISFGTPIFLADSKFVGNEAALEQVEIAVIAVGAIAPQKRLHASLPPDNQA